MFFQKGVLPIAVTRIIPMHISKGKTALQSLSARLDYATNPSKTKNGELVTAYACDPHTADAEFALSCRQYQTYTGRTQKHEVIAYQVRQSFKPGEVTPEEAKNIVRSKVPGSEAGDVRIRKEGGDGRGRFEGELFYAGMKYEFEMDPNTGIIFDWNADLRE